MIVRNWKRRWLRFSLKWFLLSAVLVGIGTPYLVDQIRWYSVPRPTIRVAMGNPNLQQIQIRARVVELPTTELRKYSARFENVAELAISVGPDGFLSDKRVVELCRSQSAKVLAEPTFLTVSGCPVTYSSEQPNSIATSVMKMLSATKPGVSGFSLDLIAVKLGNGAIRLEVRPSVVNPASPQGRVRKRWADTAVEVRPEESIQMAWFHGQASGADTGLLIQAELEVVEPRSREPTNVANKEAKTRGRR